MATHALTHRILIGAVLSLVSLSAYVVFLKNASNEDGTAYESGSGATALVMANNLTVALSEMSAIKPVLLEFYQANGRFPVSNSEAGIDPPERFRGDLVESITIRGHAIIANMHGTPAARPSIRLEADTSLERSGSVRWQCWANHINEAVLSYISTCKDGYADLITRFYAAAGSGNQPQVDTLVEELKEDRSVLTEALMLTLHSGQHKDNSKIVKTLLAAGANPNASNKMGTPALHLALQKPHHIQAATTLIDAGANPRSLDSNQETSLMRAIREKRHPDVIQLLLDQGAPIDAQNKLGQTALHLCAELGQSQTMAVLLQKKANPAIRNQNKLLPLEQALAHNQPEAVALLSATTPNAKEIITRFEMPPTRSAIPSAGYRQTELLTAIQADNLLRIKVELSRGADYRGAPLVEAARHLQVSVVRWLLGWQVDINAIDRWGMTALITTLADRKTIDERAETIVSLLIKYGVDIHQTAANQRSALHHLATSKPPVSPHAKAITNTIAQQLLAYGAQPDTTDQAGDSALSLAVHNGNTELVTLFLAQGADATKPDKSGAYLLDIAAQAGFTPMVWDLLSHGAEVNHSDLEDIKARLLYLAVYGEVPEKIDSLLNEGTLASSEVYFTGAINRVESTVALAIRTLNWPLVKRLIQTGTPLPDKIWVDLAGRGEARGEPSQREPSHNKQPIPVLEYALSHEGVGILNTLLDFGANPNNENAKGESLLIWSLKNHVNDAIEPLLKAEANPNVVDTRGESALNIATQQGNEELALLLIKHGAKPQNLTASRQLHLQAKKLHLRRLLTAIEPFLEAENLSKQLQYRLKKDQGKTLTYWAENCQQNPDYKGTSAGFYISRSGNKHRLMVDTSAGASPLPGFTHAIDLHRDARFTWQAGNQFTLKGSDEDGSWKGNKTFQQCTTETATSTLVGTWGNRRGGLNKFEVSINTSRAGALFSGKWPNTISFPTEPAYQGKQLHLPGEPVAWLIKGAETNTAFLYRNDKKPLLLYRIPEPSSTNNRFSLTTITPQ